MQIHYLEIVTKEVDAICSAYAAANSVQFASPDAGLGKVSGLSVREVFKNKPDTIVTTFRRRSRTKPLSVALQ